MKLQLRSVFQRVGILVALFACPSAMWAPPPSGGFIPNILHAPATYLFNNIGNWDQGAINGLFAQVVTDPQTIVFDADFSASELTFNLAGSSPVLTLKSDGLGNRTLSLYSNIVEVLGSSGTHITIGSDVANHHLELEINDDQTFHVDAAGNTLTIVNSIFDNSDNYSVTKDGDGSLVLAGDNNYGGGTVVGEGSLIALNATGSATGSGPVEVLSGATLQIGDGGTVGSVSGNIYVGGEASVIFERSDSLTYAGVISGEGALIFDGGAVFSLTGLNALMGGTYIAAGTVLNADVENTLSAGSVVTINATDSVNFGVLNIHQSQQIAGLESDDTAEEFAQVNIAAGKTLTIDVAFEHTHNFSGVIAGSTGGLIKIGSGTQVLSGANTFLGGTEINGGVLRIGAPNALPTTGGIQIGAYASLQLDFDQTISSLGGDGYTSVQLANDSTLTVVGASSSIFDGAIFGAGDLVKSGSGTLTLGGSNLFEGTVTINGGTLAIADDGALGAIPEIATAGMLNLDGGTLQTTATFSIDANRGIAIGSGGGTFNVGDDTLLTYGGVIAGDTLTKTGPGTLVLTGANTYVGAGGTGTVISDGTLRLGNSGGNTLAVAADVILSGDGVLQVDNDQMIRALVSDSTSTGVVIANGKTLTANMPVSGLGSNEEFKGAIFGEGSIAKSGEGVLRLIGSNTYSGGTFLNEGVLSIGADEHLGDVDGVLTFDGGTLKVTSDGAIQRAILLNSGGGTIDPYTQTVTVSGVISGVGGLTQDGVGLLILTGNNSYEGGTTVKGGGVLEFSSDVNLGAEDTGITLDGGYLRTAANFADFGRDILLEGTGGINTNEYSSTFTGQITGAGGLTITGAGGYLTLTNPDNTYSGPTNIYGGTLIVGIVNALPTNTDVSIEPGATLHVKFDQTIASLAGGVESLVEIDDDKTLTIDGAASTLFEGNISGEGNGGTYSLIKDGSGTFTLTGLANYEYANNTFELTVNGGIFQIGAGGTDGGVLGKITIGSAGKLVFNRSDPNIVHPFPVIGHADGIFEKLGAGNLTLIDADLFHGTAIITGGTVTIGADNATSPSVKVQVGAAGTFAIGGTTAIGNLYGTGATTIASGKTLTIKNTGDVSSAVSGDGAMAFDNNSNSVGITRILGNQSHTGGTALNHGVLNIGGGGSAGSVLGDIATGSGTTVVFDRTNNLDYGGSISGGAGVEKLGAGILTLSSGSHAYTGDTTISEGTLRLIASTDVLPTTTRLSMAADTGFHLEKGQTISGFLGSTTSSSILIEAGEVLNVTLGASPGAGTQFNGNISGNGAFHVGNAGGFVVNLLGANSYDGGTTIHAGGALQLGNGGATGMITGNILNNGGLYFARSDSITFTGVISGAGIVKQMAGSGSLTLTAGNSYTGGTDLYGGTLIALNVTGSATGTGVTNIWTGAKVGGNGFLSGTLNVNSGATVAPALSLGNPATLHVGNSGFGGNAKFEFQIRDANGVVGSDMSLLSISGSLAINATSLNKFTVSLYSLNGSSAGLMVNFDPDQAYSWMFVSASGAITGFDPAAFQIDLTNFQNSITGSFGAGVFGVTHSGGNLLLQYSPAAIPEPSTWALLAVGFGAVLCSVRRKRRRPEAK